MNLQFAQTTKHSHKRYIILKFYNFALKIKLWKNFEVEMIDFVFKFI